MSLFEMARSGRRPRCARPTVEALEDVCLMSTAPGLAHVAAHVARPPQPPRPPQLPMAQVRATLRAAGIPLCLQARMCKATLLADYQKALGGTTWKVNYRRPVRHLGPYLVEVPPVLPPPVSPGTGGTPVTPPTGPGTTPPTSPAQVTLAAPSLGVWSVMTRDAKLTLQAGPSGAPFGFEVLVAPLAAYQAAGNTFPANDTTTSTTHIALAAGQLVTLDYPGLEPGTQYIARAVALPGSTTSPAPGTDYLRSQPSADLVFSTKALVQLDAPLVGTTDVGTDSATVTITPGDTGAPFGILVRIAALADYDAAGGQFPAIGTTEMTIPGPLAAGEISSHMLIGLYSDTEYVVQAIALSGSKATPEPGVEYMQSEPSTLTVFGTQALIQAEPPVLQTRSADTHSILLTLTTGAQGAPDGWTLQCTTFSDYIAHGWANASQMRDVTPLPSGHEVDINATGLVPHTKYVFRANVVGLGNILTSDWSGEVGAQTLPILG